MKDLFSNNNIQPAESPSVGGNSAAKDKLETLRKQLHEHNYNYYVLSQPTISDIDFDALMQQLAELEKEYPEFYDPNSPTMRVGSDINKNFVQVQHRYPMLSLQNTYTEEEIADFFNRVKRSLNEDFEIVCELKFDGTSISLVYENGRLSQAITRGDGKQGDDVTANVRTVRNIPLVLKGDNIPGYVEVRGEILMPWSVFEELNREREVQEEPLFANPRNAASGTLKMQDSKVVAARKLESSVYYLMGERLPSDSHFENMELARKWGLNVSATMKKCCSLEEVFE
ncbi:MAG TPA: DNA ligase (NAD(+)) LigA, partial [Porphyromonadaceae bacterium]|nr:DNA ligase (NAD(+)) LigA [Porphyromonadaceae bacterium]